MEKINLKNKRGQITAFILAAFFIFAFAAVIFLDIQFMKETQEDINGSSSNKGVQNYNFPVQMFVEECITKSIKESIETEGFSDMALLEISAESSMLNCTNNFKDFKDQFTSVDIEEGLLDINLNLTKNNESILADVDYPIRMFNGEFVTEFNDFFINFPLNSNLELDEFFEQGNTGMSYAYNLYSVDNNAVITIKPETEIKYKNGSAVDEISILIKDISYNQERTALLLSYDIQPHNIVFEPAIEINISYNESELAEGAIEEDIEINAAVEDSEEWLEVESEVNEEEDEASAEITESGEYTLMYPSYNNGECSVVDTSVLLSGVMYHHWYNSGRWEAGIAYSPLLGFYDSADPSIIQKHADWSKEAGVNAWILDTWITDKDGYWMEPNTQAVIDIADETNLKYMFLIDGWEEFGAGANYDTTAIASNIIDKLSKWFNNENYVKIDGKPAVFIYAAWGKPSSVFSEIKTKIEASYGPIYLVGDNGDNKFWNRNAGYSSYVNYLSTPESQLSRQNELWDDWEDEGKAEWFWEDDKEYPWAPTAMPGYDDTNVRSGNPPIPLDPAYFNESIRIAFVHNQHANPWLLVCSFNEWHEGSQIEPSSDFEDPKIFLKTMRGWVNQKSENPGNSCNYLCGYTCGSILPGEGVCCDSNSIEADGFNDADGYCAERCGEGASCSMNALSGQALCSFGSGTTDDKEQPDDEE